MRENYKEIIKLQNMLVQNGIPFAISSFKNGCSITVYLKDNKTEIGCASEYDGSIGGNSDLLELIGPLHKTEYDNDSMIGNVTANDAFIRFKLCYNNNNANYIYDYGDRYNFHSFLLDNNDKCKIIYIYYGPPRTGKSILARQLKLLSKDILVYDDIDFTIFKKDYHTSNSNFVANSVKDIYELDPNIVCIFSNLSENNAKMLAYEYNMLLKDKYLITLCKMESCFNYEKK